MFRFRYLNLEKNEWLTFRLHTIYFAIEGIVLGVLALNEYVFIKSMQGSDYQLAFLFQFSMMVFVFLIIFNAIRKRIRNKKIMLRVTALVTRLPLVLIFFFPRNEAEMMLHPGYHYIFLGLFLIYYFGNIVIFPAINVLLKTNYRHQNFGKLYSYTTSLNKVILLVTTFIYGLMLDMNSFVFVYIFPVVAILSLISIFFLSRIPYENIQQYPKGKNILDSVRVSVRDMIHILKTNKPYLHFEIGFMLYGFAFMATYPLINIYFKDGLALNYSSVAFYKNAYNILAIFMLPFFGKLMGNIDPRKFASFSFGSLLLYLFFTVFTEYFPYYRDLWDIRLYFSLMLAFIFYGVFAATMPLLWNIGSAYFCKPSDADDYQELHLFLTGFRSLFSPVAGVFLYNLIGMKATFILAILSLILSMLVMRWSYKKNAPSGI
ncbi:MAG: MFS transporter [Bacteroidetes bacterium]|nr:MFS transporter [Bacteroidota bacterium]